jgi:glutaredoxin
MKIKQQCSLALIYGSWAIFIAGIALLASMGMFSTLVGFVIAMPLVYWLYVRVFRWVSPWVGYGRITDEPARVTPTARAQTAAHPRVTLYTAVGCPFCPIVVKRLRELQKEMGFDVHTIDVTLKPALLAQKGIWAVPVVEIGGKLLVGASTTKQLVECLNGVAGGVRA